jgi:hypothetical protein
VSEENRSFLVDVQTGFSLGAVAGDQGDIDFPAQVRGWGDVLDCRHEPFAKRSLDDLRDYASHLHKVFLLVNADRL